MVQETLLALDEGGGDCSRLHRKRFRDRKAQQAHRRRQKSHVEQLELKIEQLKDASNVKQYEALREENDSLRQQVEALKSIISKIGSLVVEEDPNPRRQDSRHDSDGGEAQQSLRQAYNCPFSPMSPARGDDPQESPKHLSQAWTVLSDKILADENIGHTSESEESWVPNAGPDLLHQRLETGMSPLRADLTDIDAWQALLPSNDIARGSNSDTDAVAVDWTQDTGKSCNIASNGIASADRDLATTLGFAFSMQGVPGSEFSNSVFDAYQKELTSLPRQQRSACMWPSVPVSTIDDRDVDDIGSPDVSVNAKMLCTQSFSYRLGSNPIVSYANGLTGTQSFPFHTPGSHYADFDLHQKELTHVPRMGRSDFTWPVIVAPTVQQDEDTRGTRFSTPNIDYRIINAQSLTTITASLTEIDVHFRQILQRAKSTFRRNPRAFANVPALTDLTVDIPSNALASDVKQYAQAVQQARPVETYLGISWLMYVLLYWETTRSREAFMMIPSWLRPTPSQSQTPHPVVIDFVVWPHWRDQLIMYAQHRPNQIVPIMAAFGMYANLSFKAAPCLENGLENAIHQAVNDLANWTMDRQFFNLYPQFQQIYTQCIAIAGVTG